MFGDEIAGAAWQHYSVSTGYESGKVLVLVKTNDNDDDGYDDGEIAEWEESFASLEAALKYTGHSRVGVSGVAVTVTVDGERV
jgi:hypothetical protein